MDRTRDDTLLLEFVKDRDAPCPACGHNLRDITEPVCPECRKDLSLSVGFLRPQVTWLLVTVAPGVFSGIAAGLLGVPLVVSYLVSHDAPAPWQVWAIDAFGWISGIAALVLGLRVRDWFLQQPPRRQRAWAVASWTIHVLAFLGAVALMQAG